ncbi:MAG: malate dehydrogenase, NAD-dependent [Piptocephalis tieghemiana]|nr:MAG: malate dehydrogenase, NAD-dependent [Piptocephalis tieghemiana]
MVKVAVLGAAGGIGQPLSLLLKSSPTITHLALYDIVNVPGVAADLSHIDTGSQVTAHVGADNLSAALESAKAVVIPAGIPRKPGMTRDDLFKINAGIVRDLAEGIAKYCPSAFVCVISNPVNSTVPIVAEVLKARGVFDPRKVFGVTTLDIVRARTFLAQASSSSLTSSTPSVTVVGGHSGITIVPLFSQQSHSLSDSDLKALIHRVQFGGDEVVKAKDGAGSATLSMAFAGARFTLNILDAAIHGKQGIIEPSYISLDADPSGAKELQSAVSGLDKVSYFSAPLLLGPRGVESIQPLGPLSNDEKSLITTAIPELQASIAKGIEFVANSKL